MALPAAEDFIPATPESGIYERYLQLPLERLPHLYRTAFAAACVERTERRLRHSAPDLELLGLFLDVVWESALRRELNRRWIDGVLQAGTAQLAAAGRCDGIRAMLACLETAAEGAAEAAVRTSLYVGRALAASGPFDPAQPRRTAANALVQAERRRQCRDLLELQKTAGAPSANVVRRLRDRAMAEAAA